MLGGWQESHPPSENGPPLRPIDHQLPNARPCRDSAYCLPSLLAHSSHTVHLLCHLCRFRVLWLEGSGEGSGRMEVPDHAQQQRLSLPEQQPSLDHHCVGTMTLQPGKSWSQPRQGLYMVPCFLWMGAEEPAELMATVNQRGLHVPRASNLKPNVDDVSVLD
jgi:hypothetical protein